MLGLLHYVRLTSSQFRLSVSSVTFARPGVHSSEVNFTKNYMLLYLYLYPTHRVELGVTNILHHLIVQGLGQFVVNFEKKFKGLLDDRTSYVERDMTNWRFSTNISHYLKNDTIYGHIAVTVDDK